MLPCVQKLIEQEFYGVPLLGICHLESFGGSHTTCNVAGVDFIARVVRQESLGIGVQVLKIGVLSCRVCIIGGFH